MPVENIAFRQENMFFGVESMKMILGEEHVVVRGIRPEEQLWGPYQFPLPYRLKDRIVVSVLCGG